MFDDDWIWIEDQNRSPRTWLSDEEYLEFVTDRLLVELQCEKVYNVTNPFDFMGMISLQGKTNFFEKGVSEYQKAGVLNNDTRSEEISFDEDF